MNNIKPSDMDSVLEFKLIKTSSGEKIIEKEISDIKVGDIGEYNGPSNKLHSSNFKFVVNKVEHLPGNSYFNITVKTIAKDPIYIQFAGYDTIGGNQLGKLQYVTWLTDSGETFNI